MCVDRVPGFVERSLRDLEARRLNRSHIDATIETIVTEHCKRFVYNPHICRYYEIGKQRMQLRVRTIDSILVELMGAVPLLMRSHRHYILRAVRARIGQQHVLKWTPSKRCVERMTQEVRRHFGSYEDAVYFMSVVGAIVLRREGELFAQENEMSAGDDPKESVVHLWHGPRVEELVEGVQRVLHQTTGTFSPFWNRVKRRMHRSYQLDSLWSLHFPSSTQTPTPRILRQSPLLWIVACCQHYRQRPFRTWAKHLTIRFTRALPTTDALFVRFVEERVILSDDCDNGVSGGTSASYSPTLGPACSDGTDSSASTAQPSGFVLDSSESASQNPSPDTLEQSVPSSQGPLSSAIGSQESFLLPREVMAEFQEYLTSNALPRDLVTKQELLRLMETHFKHERYGSRASKCLYRGALSVSVYESVHDLFLRFTQDVLVPPLLVTDEGAVSDVPHAPPAITTRQLHSNYQMWCRHYSRTLADAELESGEVHCEEDGATCVDAPALIADGESHTQHWYCSYTLFETFMNRAFSTRDANTAVSNGENACFAAVDAVSVLHIKKSGRRHWCCRVAPPSPLWRLYLQHFQHIQPGVDFQPWLSAEFGIELADTTCDNNTCPASLTESLAMKLDDQDIGHILAALQHQHSGSTEFIHDM